MARCGAQGRRIAGHRVVGAMLSQHRRGKGGKATERCYQLMRNGMVDNQRTESVHQCCAFPVDNWNYAGWLMIFRQENTEVNHLLDDAGLVNNPKCEFHRLRCF